MSNTEKRKLLELAVDRILPNPDQPRQQFTEDDLHALAASIRDNGLLQPLLVRREANGYVLIAGERRLRAAKMLGRRTVPVVVQENSPREGAILALIENLQRKDLHYLEEAVAMQALLAQHGMTQEAVARRLGLSQPALSNKLRLLRFSQEERQLLRSAGLSERHARALIRLADPVLRIRTLHMVMEKALSVAETEQLVQDLLHPTPAQTPPPPPSKPRRTVVIKDVRLFFNTFDKAVSTMKQAGIAAFSERRETGDYYECIVRIPKSHSSTR